MPNGKPRLPLDLIHALDEALKLVPEAKEAFTAGDIIKAAALIVKQGAALLKAGSAELGKWLQETGLALRMHVPFNMTV